MAKKGIWVSEYRIESGLNCGGHAFATDGYLLGPVLAEFKERRKELVQTTQDILLQALETKNRFVPKETLPIKISAQGGVGTADEHQFLLDHYQVDSVGWGTPFLLVPEATSVDDATLEKLVNAKEGDLYLSDISPLCVPFNNLRDNTKDAEKERLIKNGKPGSSCPKKFVALNTEFTEKGICTASRKYQQLKLRELDNEHLDTTEHQLKYAKIVEKSCTCVGLGTSTLLVHDLDTKIEGKGVSVCPGPNLAYFSKIMSLKEITDHIYNRAYITRPDRPNMFINELNIYIDFLKNIFQENQAFMSVKQENYLKTFVKNLNEGIAYYQQLFNDFKDQSKTVKAQLLEDLETSKTTLSLLYLDIEHCSK